MSLDERGEALSTTVPKPPVPVPVPKFSPQIKKVLDGISKLLPVIDNHRIYVCEALRTQLLPLILQLRKVTKRKSGYYAALESIHLNAATVRGWFFQGLHGNELIGLLETDEEKQVNAAREQQREERRTERMEEVSEEDFLQLADRMARAILKHTCQVHQAARNLAKDYAEARRLVLEKKAA
jgi:hypothetical protein